MGCPATTEPPQPYSRRRVYSLAVLPAAFTLARTQCRVPILHHTLSGEGSFGAPPPAWCAPFSTLPFLFLRKYRVFYTAFNKHP